MCGAMAGQERLIDHHLCELEPCLDLRVGGRLGQIDDGRATDRLAQCAVAGAA
jgi:hypothetical protein